MWHSNILQWVYYVCTPTLLSNPMHVAGHIVSLNKRSLPTSQRTASSTTLFSHVWLDSTQCRLWNRDVLKWKTSDIKTSSRTKLQHMTLCQLPLFLSLEKWPSRDSQDRQVSHAIAIEAERVEVVQASSCCTTHSGQDLGGENPTSKRRHGWSRWNRPMVGCWFGARVLLDIWESRGERDCYLRDTPRI